MLGSYIGHNEKKNTCYAIWESLKKYWTLGEQESYHFSENAR